MSQQQRPTTYGDVFNVPGELGSEPITKEDASLMQSAETRATGQTRKGGAAAAMQSAADRNVQTGAIDEDTHTRVCGEGVSVVETLVPGGVVDTEYVAGHAVLGVMRPGGVDVSAVGLDAVGSGTGRLGDVSGGDIGGGTYTIGGFGDVTDVAGGGGVGDVMGSGIGVGGGGGDTNAGGFRDLTGGGGHA